MESPWQSRGTGAEHLVACYRDKATKNASVGTALPETEQFVLSDKQF